MYIKLYDIYNVANINIIISNVVIYMITIYMCYTYNNQYTCVTNIIWLHMIYNITYINQKLYWLLIILTNYNILT